MRTANDRNGERFNTMDGARAICDWISLPAVS